MTDVLATPTETLVPHQIDGTGLTIADVVAVARRAGGPVPEITEPALAAMTATVRLRDSMLAQDIPIYGVTTGFGDSSGRQIGADKAALLQRNLVLYHLNGIGPTAAPQVARATMLIRANCLVRGPSAVRPLVVRTLLRLLAEDILPLIPERGSLGASGDLVPLCYLAAALIGEGEVMHRGRIRPAAEALRTAGIEPVVLEPKEGLSLINGTSFTAAFAVLAAWEARELASIVDVTTALAVEALHGNASHFDPFLHAAKPHPGQVTSAEVTRTALAGSALTTTYRDLLGGPVPDGAGAITLPRRIQDRYSVRCAPHVNGVLRDTLAWVDPWLTTEINSSTDNPLFAADSGELHHGGNFYAGHVGQAMDSLKVAVASVADLVDRQLALLVDEKFNAGLPPNLIASHATSGYEAGLHHGFKGMQIACSSVTAEALKTAAPATTFSRSTEAHNQDKVSMATIAARDARTVVDLTTRVVAIHLLAAAQAVELRGVALASPVARRVHELVRAHVPFADRDRRMDGDIEAVTELIRTGAVRQAAGLPDPLFA